MKIDRRIKFRHLACFLEVAGERSIVKAAERLSISQPAASKTLKELEDILGVRLFERGKRNLDLTQAGLTFLRHVAPGLKALGEGIDSVRDHRRLAGTVRVGVLSTVETAVIPEVIRRLHGRQAGPIVSVYTGASAYLLSQLRVGELDLVVGRMTEAREIQGLAFEHLYNDSMLLAVRPRHPLLAMNLSEHQRIGEFPLVLPLEGTTIRKHADSFFARHGISLAPRRLETLSPSLSRRYVLDTDAIWAAPADAVAADLHAGILQRLPVAMEEQGGSIGFSCNDSLTPSAATLSFCEILREVAGEIMANGRRHFS
ncbi:MAG: pca operon transcription factor PcaQ [Aquisalimonadaceae bacterium]